MPTNGCPTGYCLLLSLRCPASPVTRLRSALFPAFLELFERVVMTPLEDRLQEYLSQFDDEPAIAPSLKRSTYLEQLLTRVGIVPTNSIELPANITPELHNNLLTEGEGAMTSQSSPTRVRIYSHTTQSRF